MVFRCNYVSTLHYLKILKDTVNHFHKFKEVHQTSIKPRQYLHIKFEMPLFSHSEGITVAVPEIRLGLPKFKRSRDRNHAPSERYVSDLLWSTYVLNLKSLISTHYKGMKGDARVPIIMRSRYGDYICPVVSSSLSFFRSPNLSGHRVDAYHTSTHGVALVQI